MKSHSSLYVQVCNCESAAVSLEVLQHELCQFNSPREQKNHIANSDITGFIRVFQVKHRHMWQQCQ
jgi:hypothetical protein